MSTREVIESRNKKMWLLSYVTCVGMFLLQPLLSLSWSRVTWLLSPLTKADILFARGYFWKPESTNSDPKPGIMIIILPTDWPKMIFSSVRTKKSCLHLTFSSELKRQPNKMRRLASDFLPPRTLRETSNPSKIHVY